MTTITQEPKSYTPIEVARMFQVHKYTVYTWLQRGIIRGVKLGGVWRIPESSVDSIREKPVDGK